MGGQGCVRGVCAVVSVWRRGMVEDKEGKGSISLSLSPLSASYWLRSLEMKCDPQSETSNSEQLLGCQVTVRSEDGPRPCVCAPVSVRLSVCSCKHERFYVCSEDSFIPFSLVLQFLEHLLVILNLRSCGMSMYFIVEASR